MRSLLGIAAALSLVTLVPYPLTAQPSPPPPLVKPEGLKKVSDHVSIIPDNSVQLVPNVGIIVGDIMQQHRSPFLEKYDHGQYARLKDLAAQVQREVGERDVIIAEQDRALSYFSRRRCVPPLTARRWPATEAEWESYRTLLASADNLFVVLPGKHVEELARQLPMTIDTNVIATAGDPVRWSLHRAKLTSGSKIK